MALKSFQLAPCETISIFFVPPWPRALGSSPRCLGLGFHGSWCQGCIRLKYFTILQKYFARLEVLLAEVLSKCKSLPNRGLNIRGLWGSQGPPGGTDFFGFSPCFILRGRYQPVRCLNRPFTNPLKFQILTHRADSTFFSSPCLILLGRYQPIRFLNQLFTNPLNFRFLTHRADSSFFSSPCLILLDRYQPITFLKLFLHGP